MTVLLEAVNVVKRYDGAGTNAVNGISLQVEEGEFYSFLGPSGCGKTTLLRIFAGFETLTTGSVLIGGKVMNDLPAYRRPVNMVFQSYALFPHLSVFENVAFGLRHGAGRKITGLDIAAEVDKALDTVRLKALKNRMPSQLSGGQQQRVALARALAVRPLVLLLDEPLSALDVQIREEMQEELSRLKRELNMTFVMVTHDQSEALALSSRVAVFNAGNLEQVGSARQVYEEPATPFVASFIGNSNLLEGKLKEGGGALSKVELPSGEIIEVLTPASLGAGAPVKLVFKPETVQLTESSKSSPASLSEGNNRLAVKVRNISYQGSFTDLTFTTTGGAELKASLPSHDLPPLSLGDAIAVFLPPQSLRLLAAAGSGET
ncbi:MAG TPA: ABC transporter ATP-binding protein [Candidatus Obscuribacter sp.]|nr:ABC transporter ATP-binding protein [Candidatus Obscuribacter sp.]HNH74925.1 ABC transporter ATP-binding protein [Candidatus Obscuribacter sp.]